MVEIYSPPIQIKYYPIMDTNIMVLLNFLIVINIYSVVFAAFCKKEFFYHQYYSYGYDIYCNDLDNETLTELTQTVVYNEIKLTIENSDLRNTKWHVVKHLPRLREINILQCNLDDPTIFTGLTKLSLLNIQHSIIDKTDYGFLKDLSDLQQLILKDNSVENSIFHYLQNLDMLSMLNINNNNLSGTFNATDCACYNLEQVFLQYNFIQELGNISCLKYVEEIYLDFNSISKIQNLNKLINLKVLSLSNNNIEDLGGIQNLDKLEKLNLQGNKLSVLNEKDLYNLNNLKYLNLEDNQIYTILDTFFANILNLKYLNLGNNSIDSISLKYVPQIQEINISNNKITSLNIFANSTKLNVLDLSWNHIREIDQYVFSKLSKLVALNCSHNGIGSNIYDTSFFGLSNLEDLQMVNTSTLYIPENAFIFSTKLVTLNLSRNKIQQFNKLFEKLFNLKTLNISYNRLTELQYNTIKDLHNLRVIDIEGNMLKNIEYESIVTYLQKLMTINIKNNSLSCEFLAKMITFFNSKHVNYTINEEFNYDKENVAGIYCKETKNKYNDTLSQTSLVLEGNTVLLKQLFNLTKNNTSTYNKTLTRSVTYATVFVLLISVVLSLAFYKVYLYIKRKHYCSDEFELIDRDKD